MSRFEDTYVASGHFYDVSYMDEGLEPDEDMEDSDWDDCWDDTEDDEDNEDDFPVDYD